MPQFRVIHFAGIALLLICGLARAADNNRPRGAVESVQQAAVMKPIAKKPAARRKPAVKKRAKRVIALPSEFASLIFAYGQDQFTFAGRRIDTAFAADTHAAWDIPSNLLPAPLALGRADAFELNLSETRVSVWLRDDLNVHCDLMQDPAIARGDQLAVKVALQFRFR